MPASNIRRTKKRALAKIKIHNRQKHPLPAMRNLQKRAEAIPGLLGKAWPVGLTLVEVILVDERESSRVHQEFMHDSSATDVITFEHGELVICPAVAERQRGLEKLSLEAEILTYIIHGCLHLCGMEDHTDAGFRQMKLRQTQIRKKLITAETQRARRLDKKNRKQE